MTKYQRRKSLLFVVLLCIVSLGATVGWAANRTSEPPHARPAESGRAFQPTTTHEPSLTALSLYIGAVRQAQLDQYLTALDTQRVADYVIALEQQQIADYLAAQQQKQLIPSVTPQNARTPDTSGRCGGATNGADAYIQQESGGNPNVYNSGGSGAWGCYQLMPEHFAPGGACSDMTYGAASPAQQAQCASRLPLSAWGG